MKAMMIFLSGIPLQANLPANDPIKGEISQLDGTVLIPAVCLIMLAVIVASVVITAQKHKRY